MGKLSYLFFLLIFLSISASAQLPPIDRDYDGNVKTVLFYPVDLKGNKGQLDIPVIFLHEQGSEKLRLEFDEMGNQYRNYFLKIIPYNADWTPSMLTDLEILSQFNEFIPTSYEVSNNTRQPYIHYVFELPQILLSGNYLLKIYKNYDDSQVVITRRFMVVENLVNIDAEVVFPVNVNRRFSGQQIDFTVNYGQMELVNPREMVKCMIRQNGRWDNAIQNLPPMYLRDEDHVLDYKYFNDENVFNGLNEYRSFDIRSMRFLGFGMATTKFDNKGVQIGLATDTNRNKPNYNQAIDINGWYVIDNFETRTGATEADYADVTFSLKLKKPVQGKIYIMGRLTNWEIKPDFEMIPDSTGKYFKQTLRLKQGFYNYAFGLVSEPGSKPDEIALEGSYNLTENKYDIIMYFRPIGMRYDRIIGYKLIKYLARR